MTTVETGKILIVQVISVLDNTTEVFRATKAEGKYINSIDYVPDGYTHHETLEDAVEEQINQKYLLNFEEQNWLIARLLKTKRLFGYKDLKVIEVEITRIKEEVT